MLIVLECAYQGNDERVVDGRHDVLLPDYPLHLVMSNDVPLVQHFKRVNLAGLLVTSEPHLTERTHAQYAEFHEILKIDGPIDFRGHDGGYLSESGNVTDYTLDRALRKHATYRLLHGGNCLWTDRRVVGLDRLIPKVIPRTQSAYYAIVVCDSDLSLPNDVEILPRSCVLHR